QPSTAAPTKPNRTGVTTISTARVKPSLKPLLIFRLVARSNTRLPLLGCSRAATRELVNCFAIYRIGSARGQIRDLDRRRRTLATSRPRVPTRQTGTRAREGRCRSAAREVTD